MKLKNYLAWKEEFLKSFDPEDFDGEIHRTNYIEYLKVLEEKLPNLVFSNIDVAKFEEIIQPDYEIILNASCSIYISRKNIEDFMGLPQRDNFIKNISLVTYLDDSVTISRDEENAIGHIRFPTETLRDNCRLLLEESDLKVIQESVAGRLSYVFKGMFENNKEANCITTRPGHPLALFFAIKIWQTKVVEFVFVSNETAKNFSNLFQFPQTTKISEHLGHYTVQTNCELKQLNTLKIVNKDVLYSPTLFARAFLRFHAGFPQSVGQVVAEYYGSEYKPEVNLSKPTKKEKEQSKPCSIM